MKDQMITKKTKITFWILVILALIIWTAGLIRWYMNQPVELYCTYEKTYSEPLPRYECTQLKVISYSKDFNMSTFTDKEFDKVTCGKDLISCPDTSEHYYDEYPLVLFCDGPDCIGNGIVCAGFNIDYLPWEVDVFEKDQAVAEFKKMFSTTIITPEEIEGNLKDCEMR